MNRIRGSTILLVLVIGGILFSSYYAQQQSQGVEKMPTRLYRLFTFLFFRKHFDTHESTYNDLELETIGEIKWPQVENISYVSMRSNLVIAYRYLKYQEDICKDAYTIGLILGILIIIFGIILMFLDNFIMGPVLLGIGVLFSIMTSLLIVQINHLLKQKLAISETIAQIDKQHISFNEVLRHTMPI